MSKPYRQKTRKGPRDMDVADWPLLMCKCGRTIGRYPPNDTRIDRSRCLTCIIEGQQRDHDLSKPH